MAPTPESSRLLRFGVFELDVRARELRKHGVRLRLQPQPAQILTLLLQSPGKVVTREEIRAEVWGPDTFVDFEHGLNNAIKKIREVLDDSSDEPRYIETLPKVGYRFLAEVEFVHPQAAHRPGPVAVMPQPQLGQVKKESKAAGRNRLWVAVAAAGAAIGGAIWLVAPRQRIGEPVRFSLELPEHLKFEGVGFTGSPVAFSPDGSEIVVVAREGKTVRLYRRKLRDPQFEPVAGSESARAPVYSADGKWLVFADINERQLKRLPVGGGVAEKLHGVNLTFFGIHQSGDGRLWFGDCGSGLMCRRVDGSTDRLTNVTSGGNEIGAVDREHSFPEVLPGGGKLMKPNGAPRFTPSPPTDTWPTSRGRRNTPSAPGPGSTGRERPTGVRHCRISSTTPESPRMAGRSVFSKQRVRRVASPSGSTTSRPESGGGSRDSGEMPFGRRGCPTARNW